MDDHMISLFALLNKVHLVVVVEEAGLVAVDLMLIQWLRKKKVATPTTLDSMPSNSLDDGFSRDEIATFRRFVSQLDHPNAPSSSFSYSGNSTSTLSVFISIDLGVSHYITGMSSFFTSYMVSSKKDKDQIADGFFSSITG